MSIWGSILRAVMPDNMNRDPLSDFWYEAVTVASSAGVAVTADNAVRVPGVFGCLQATAKPLATLPVIVYRKKSDGSKEILPDHPIARLMHDGPNDDDTGAEWRGQMQWELALYKNCYSEIIPQRGAGDTFFSSLEHIHPKLVDPQRDPSGRIVYQVRDQMTGMVRTVPKDRMFHIKALPLRADGLAGMPVIETGTGRDTIGQAIAVQEFTSRFFANDMQSGGVIEGMSFKSQEDKDRFQEALRRARTRRNAWRALVLEFGGKFVANPIDPEKGQMIETRKQLAVEICAIFDIPPHIIGILDKATNNNIEQQSLEFVIKSFAPWAILWQHRIKKDLILEDDVFVEFDVIPLLRGDLKSRYEAFAIGRNWGWLSANDIRKLENMDPIPDGDTYLEPLNMTPSGGERAPTPNNPALTPPKTDPSLEPGDQPDDARPSPSPAVPPRDKTAVPPNDDQENAARARELAFQASMANVVSIRGRRLGRAIMKARA